MAYLILVCIIIALVSVVVWMLINYGDDKLKKKVNDKKSENVKLTEKNDVLKKERSEIDKEIKKKEAEDNEKNKRVSNINVPVNTVDDLLRYLENQ